MASSSAPDFAPPTSFPCFPSLPTELRLKIWSSLYTLTPPALIPFYLCKSDLDYLRLKRKACHDYPHIFASRMKRVPPILHACRESREIGLQHYSLGFDINRLLSMGRAETDVETYTTCSHEISMGDVGRQVYWDRSKDVVLLQAVEWLDEKKAAYVWGGKTGVWFGRMKKVAMDFDTLTSYGIGEYLGWEGVDEMLVLRSDSMSIVEMEEEGRWDWGNKKIGKAGYVKMYLTSRKMNGVDVKFEFESMREVLEYVESSGR
ncbi:hypothetical protein D0Z07_8863 [Hyphodiscus hymeniophilus]|uniref:2EXR domain-containing protein n=1 Tax=Hyphodiscus hymeniophilus TaxID=353542 RepID=A0A9P6SJZ1_9HELO|nr:hypothetical protein D0Z07_8863 [Hyphodiscus hymeniophilus]